MKRETHRSNCRYKKQVAAAFMLLGTLSATSTAFAQSGRLSAGKQSKIEIAISRFMADSKAPGVSAAVVQDGEFVWSAGFGMADLENSVPATSQTLYRLGSISKPITATAAMQLWEHGSLDLDAPVQTHCPAFPQKPWPITTRELLGHLGGIRSYHVPELPYTESEADPEVGNTHHFEDGIGGGIKFFANDPLVAQPGTHFTYSTHGYTLVGCAIEGASGEKYAEYVRRNVLMPAGMLQTRPDDRFAIVPLRTRFYSKDKSGAVVNAEFLDSSYKVPGGGWLSSAQDMARFEVATLSDRLVTRATRDLMWIPQKPSDGLGRMVYGLGWGVGQTEGVRDVGHGGSQQGTSTLMLIAPDARAGIVVLINSDTAGANALGSQLLKIVLGLPEGQQKEISVDPGLYDAYVGTYKMDGFALTIGRENGHLFAEINGRNVQLFPKSIRDYFFKAFDSELSFVTDSNGRATDLILHEGGIDIDAVRVK